MSNNSSVPGLTNPTMQSMAAGNPRDSAIANTAAASAKQAEANRMTAGSKKRGGSGVVVPTLTPGYVERGGPGQTTTDITKSNAQTGVQGAANAKYDENALKGGSRRKRKGGNPDWNWGCSSGGKRIKKNRSNKRKTRKHRKKTRRNKK